MSSSESEASESERKLSRGKMELLKKGHKLETLRLIAEVRKQPAVWDRTHPSYKCKQTRRQCWNDVCRNLYEKFDEMESQDKYELILFVTSKWNNVRDSYRKHSKLLKQGKVPNKSYIYGNKMRFLDGMYSYNITSAKAADGRKASFRENKVANDVEVEYTDYQELSHEFIDVTLDNSTGGDDVQMDSLRSDANNDSVTNVVDDNVVSVLVDMLRKEEDQDRSFFNSILPTVKSLPEKDKFTFRIEVMKLLQSLKKHKKNNNLKSEIEINRTESENDE